MSDKECTNFVQASATTDAKGNSSMTAKDYLRFMEERGITKEILKSVDEGHNVLIKDALAFNATNLMGLVEKAKEAGTDPMVEKTRTVINTTNGQIRVQQTAAKTYPVPGTADKTTVVLPTKVIITASRGIDKATQADCEDQMRKLLGL